VQSPLDAARKRWILALTCLAQFMVILDISVVNVALPSIRKDLGFSAVDLQWVVNAYTLTFAGFLLLGGRAADLLGRRRVFVAGLLLFAAASLAGGLSTSQGMLTAARAVQGLGGAVVAPATLAIITTTFDEGYERNRALGYWGAMGAVGGSTGVLLGGVLTQLLGWQWILFINVPVGVLGAMGAMRFISESTRTAAGERHFDVAGALSVTAGLVLLTFAIVRTDVNGWTSAPTLEVAGAGLALLVLFVFIERRAPRPLIPLGIFRSRTLTAANLVVFLLGCSVFAMWYFVSLYLQQVLGYTPIETGLCFLPMTGAIIVASTFAARLSARLGPGPILTLGMTLLRQRRPSRRRRHHDGPRAVLRARHHRGRSGRPALGGRAGLGPGQHLAPGRRLAGAGRARDDRDPAHERPRWRPRPRRERAHRRLPARLRGRRDVRVRRRADRARRARAGPPPAAAGPTAGAGARRRLTASACARPARTAA
jgi:MFS family permease